MHAHHDSLTRTLATVLLGAALLAAHAAVASDTKPRILVERLTSRILPLTAPAAGTDSEARASARTALIRHIGEHVDIHGITRATLGKHWQSATELQRAELEKEVTALLTTAYAVAMRDVEVTDIEYLPTRCNADDTRALVRTRITRQGRPALDLNYRLAGGEGGWRFVDVTVNGISVVTTYRSSFNAVVAADGVEALLDQLRSKNQDETT